MLSDANKKYNTAQKEVGHSLRSLRGKTISRSPLGVGRAIGRRIYFHKSYWMDVLNEAEQKEFLAASAKVPFKYTCVRYTRNFHECAFIECPDFDSAREPIMGSIYTVTPTSELCDTHFHGYIIQHKWTYVKNNYTGFNVRTSWEWSKKWLSTLTETPVTTSRDAWTRQLEKFSL